MSAKNIQHFAGGIFLATSLLAGAYYYNSTETQEPVTVVEEIIPTSAEMKETLEDEGYIVLTAEEYEETKEVTPTEVETEVEIRYTMLLQIREGMTSQEIAAILVRGNIIDDSSEFTEFVQDQQLTQVIRTGEYELTSTMTIAEIVELIT
ncbi:hypothetical protein [Bacillus suaedae]|uniref:Endolytic transglycosylase MltG n=1 Tax=Halalkalibacter suaedae TaxID=2822140 RepID=A0A941AP96_9BACI|nr:hypothetical protein [Bacillus suaedae]MBP3951252.1 hypothetical protein [Bacillus suaedae]